MKRLSALILTLFLTGLPLGASAAGARTKIDLNGTWEFEQSAAAFPPSKFTRKIPVPGLIYLAEPKIDQLAAYVDGTYQPRYNWYRRTFRVPDGLEKSQAVLTLLKSMYVTHVYLNGIDLGQSIACYTPVEFPVSHALRYGAENELLVCVGDRKWLPSDAAGSTDKEKITYWPGIWDEVSVSFTGAFRVNRALMLPSLERKKVIAKVQVRSFFPAQVRYGDPMLDSCRVEVSLREKKSGAPAGERAILQAPVKRDNLTELALELPLPDARPWSPEDPFLYTATVVLRDLSGQPSDSFEVNFGMRDFTRKGKHFLLNGAEYILRGTNITLHRFFEDPECKALPWDSQWVGRLLTDIPRRLNWNAMRVCVGIAPKFWYDIADESGLLIQNEWLYWQTHGWDEQIRAEYTDWVWTDGNHPSIVIWDAINENWDSFIGNVLIPDLKKLDPTRIWDAGYMTSEQMNLDEMDEPHPYTVYGQREDLKESLEKNPYSLGALDNWPLDRQYILNSSSAQLVNEYGWIWLWRDGRPAKLTVNNFDYYLGPKATPEECRELQAYWLQLETEWLRAERSLAGVLAFCYLTNNYGFTGDWFVGPVARLEPGPTLKWFKSCFAPAAVFIDLTDGRYMKHVPPREPGSRLTFDLVGVNDLPRDVPGQVVLRVLDDRGRESLRETLEIVIPAFYKKTCPVSLELPRQGGGYLLLAEFTPQGGESGPPSVSRRYFTVKGGEPYKYYNLAPRW
jgi:beta-galactosidase